MLALTNPFSHAGQGELILLTPNNHAMPIAEFSNGKQSADIMKDVGDAIDTRLGLRVRHVTVPNRRVALVLAQGEADGVCYVQPYWIDDNHNRSAPMFPNGALVLVRADAPVIASAPNLRGKKV